MKHLKVGLRIWIAISSIFGFLAGWVMLGHSPKPAQAAQAVSVEVQPVALPTLAPLPDFSQPNAAIQPLQPMPQTSFFMPRLRTGGS
jgi:hypothetical protein